MVKLRTINEDKLKWLNKDSDNNDDINNSSIFLKKIWLIFINLYIIV